MNDNIKLYCEARDFLVASSREKVEVFMSGIWDPLMKFVIIKEINDILEKEIAVEYPELPSKYYPKCRIRMPEDDNILEVNIQAFLNRDPNLVFLGTGDVGSMLFDYYMTGQWSPTMSCEFIARYGHDEKSVYTGSKTAEAEYYMGAFTPLAIAYGMAVDDGFIS